MTTDVLSDIRYKDLMVRKPSYRTSPATPMNQWVRDALEAGGLSQQALSEGLSRASGLGSYDRSMVQKMTVSRKISMDEARVISQLTGHPLPDTEEGVEVMTDYMKLSSDSQAAIRTLMKELLKRQQDDESEE